MTLLRKINDHTRPLLFFSIFLGMACVCSVKLLNVDPTDSTQIATPGDGIQGRVMRLNTKTDDPYWSEFSTSRFPLTKRLDSSYCVYDDGRRRYTFNTLVAGRNTLFYKFTSVSYSELILKQIEDLGRGLNICLVHESDTYRDFKIDGQYINHGAFNIFYVPRETIDCIYKGKNVSCLFLVTPDFNVRSVFPLTGNNMNISRRYINYLRQLPQSKL